MNKRQFVRQRKPSWDRFESLVNRLDRVSPAKMSAAEVAEFSRLFRELSNDLAVIRSRAWGGQWVSYLNHLVARGHNSFYSAPPGNLAKFLRYLAVDFPRLFRANIAYFLVASLLFFVPGGISWAVVQNDPALAARVLSHEQLRQFDAMYGDASPPADEEAAEHRRATGAETGDGRDEGESDIEEDLSGRSNDEPEWDGGFGEERAFMAGFYVYNNVGIALRCFALGILLGAGTVYVLLYNGIVLGTISGYVISQGNAERFLSFVISHGSFELTAIAVAGGAGLMLGNALLHPGQRTRIESLRVRGLQAVQIAAGAAVMLIIAALIEAFWSPAGVPATWKYVGGTGLWLLVILYLALAGRGAEGPASSRQNEHHEP